VQDRSWLLGRWDQQLGDLLLPALKPTVFIVMLKRGADPGSGSLGLVAGRRLVTASLRQSRVEVLDTALQSLDEARRVDGAPLVGRPADLRPSLGDRHGDLVESTVDVDVNIEASEVSDGVLLGSARHPFYQGRDQPVEVIASVHPLTVGSAVHGHPELVASGVLAPLEGGFELVDTPSGIGCPTLGVVQRAPEPVLVVHVSPPEPTEPGHFRVDGRLLQDERIASGERLDLGVRERLVADVVYVPIDGSAGGHLVDEGGLPLDGLPSPNFRRRCQQH